MGMRWQNLFLELQETPLSVQSCPRKLVFQAGVGKGSQPRGGWGCQKLLAAWISAPRIPHLPLPGSRPCTNTRRGFSQNFPFGETSRGECSGTGRGCSRQGNGLVQSLTLIPALSSLIWACDRASLNLSFLLCKMGFWLPAESPPGSANSEVLIRKGGAGALLWGQLVF